MQVNAVVIDDEQNNIENLVFLLGQYCPEIKVIGSAIDADEGRGLIMQLDPAIVFLDIQMPGKNGFDLLRSLSSYSFEIIFVTAFDHYGIQAIKFAAIDYLLKPVDTDELKQAVAKAILHAVKRNQNQQVENLIQLLQQRQDREQHRIALPTLTEIRFVLTQDIIRCEANNNYTYFFLSGGEKLIVSKPIFDFEEMLTPYSFVRCHQSHLINKKYVKSWIKGDGGYLLLFDKTEIPVSRHKRDLVKKELGKG